MAMQIVYLIGRFLFVAIFLVSGLRKLLDLAGTAKLIEPKLWTLPAAVQPYVDKLTAMSGMSSAQLVAIVLAVVQILFALFIIFNLGSRFAAIVLAIYIAVATFYSYDFTNLSELARGEAGTGLMKNIALFGGLLVLFVIGSWQPGVIQEEEEYVHETHA
jgi:putative oxidoreductase